MTLPGGERWAGRDRSLKAWNVKRALQRTRRRLDNSMAHTPRPRAGDVARWQAMRTRIAALEAALAELEAKKRRKADADT